ncbi:MAG TPA: DUF4124 domain-containing protein [Marinagarivorans sp.]
MRILNSLKSAAGIGVVSIAVASFCATALASGVYKSVDENGKVTYSDAPTGNKIDPVDLPHINTTPAVEPKPYTPPAPKPATTQYRVAITSPSNGAEILAGQRDLSVSARVEPSLGDGYSAQLYMNNSPYGGAQPSTSFVITEIIRGEHQLSVAVLNPNGKVVARSNSVTVYVRRPTI